MKEESDFRKEMREFFEEVDKKTAESRKTSGSDILIKVIEIFNLFTVIVLICYFFTTYYSNFLQTNPILRTIILLGFLHLILTHFFDYIKNGGYYGGQRQGFSEGIQAGSAITFDLVLKTLHESLHKPRKTRKGKES